MQHLINAPRRAYSFKIVVFAVALAVAIIGLAASWSDSALAQPTLQQQTSAFYWGTDSEAYVGRTDTPSVISQLPHHGSTGQDFYIGRLGAGPNFDPLFCTNALKTIEGIVYGPTSSYINCLVEDIGPVAPATQKVTYAFWHFIPYMTSPSYCLPIINGGPQAPDAYTWGRNQAMLFIEKVQANSNYIGGHVLFGDFENFNTAAPCPWTGGATANNREVIRGFLEAVSETQIPNTTEHYKPGIYTNKSFWPSYLGSDFVPDQSFVLWLAWPPGGSETNTTSDQFDENVVLNIAEQQVWPLTYGGQHPVIWQFDGDRGDLTLQNPANGFIPWEATRMGFDDVAFGPNDDGTYPCTSQSSGIPSGCTPQSQDLGFDINFLGTTYRYVYVNNNGNLTFDSPLATYTPFGLAGTNQVIIAPFFADVDTRVGPTVSFGRGTVNGHPAFGVNWPGVGCFSQNIAVRNSFQVVLIERSDRGAGDFDIEFNYDQVQWDTGEASGGNANCLGQSSARVGYSNGAARYYELLGSGVPGALLDTGSLSLIQRSQPASPQLGHYVFEVKNGVASSGGSISGQIQANASSALGGAFVQACNQASGSCRTSNTTASGQYAIDGLNAGQYRVTAYSPSGTNLLPGALTSVTVITDSTTANQNISLPNPQPLPVNTQITSRATGNGGIPIVYWRADLTLSTSGCSNGTASYQILQDGAAIRSGTLVQTTPGLYTGTIPALYPAHGYATVSTQLLCPGAAAQNEVFDIYIDPSGVVRDTSGTPLPGATVTLYRSDNASGPFAAVPQDSGLMSVANRNNPSTTDVNGLFGWDVLAGFYKVRAEKAGCVMPNDPTQPFVESAVLTIPPAITDLDLRLNCNTTGTLTLTSIADARVKEISPTVNFGTSSRLDADGSSGDVVQSYLRFNVSGLSGPVQRAVLRLKATSNGTINGPQVFSTSNAWEETTVTWSNRPAPVGGILGNAGVISPNTWIEYDVTALIAGNGTYNLMLIPDNSDGVEFSSRQGDALPELVLTLAQSSMPVPRPFGAVADARVKQESPTANYGTSTMLDADGSSGDVVQSYLRFNVSGLARPVQRAVLRVKSLSNGTVNGPQVFSTSNAWEETAVTWNNRPAPEGAALGNAGAIGPNTWVEYDVTALVTGNGIYNFVLIPDHSDGVEFSSRQGDAMPQLLITLAP